MISHGPWKYLYYLEKLPLLTITLKIIPRFCHIIVLFFDSETTPNRLLVQITKVNSKSLEFVQEQ